MKTIEELSRVSAVCCREIYNDFTMKEIGGYPKSIQEAWHNGRDLIERHNYINNTSMSP